MSVRVRSSGGQNKLKGIKVRASGGLQTIKKGWIRDGSGLRKFWDWAVMVVNPMIGSITAHSWTSSLGNRTVSTFSSVKITVIGGTAPLTYAWTRTSGDAMTLTNGTTDTPTMSMSLAPDTSAYATYQCLVTDATGAQITVVRNITLELFYLPPAGEIIP